MKFAKYKINRCHKCIYYHRIGNFHFCAASKSGEYEGLGYLKVICSKRTLHDNKGGKHEG